MKVVCVDDRNYSGTSHLYNPQGGITVGHVYTVIEVLKFPNEGDAYVLAEKPVIFLPRPTEKAGWKAERFVRADYYSAEFAVSQDLEVPTTNPHPLPLGLIRESSGFQRQLSF